MQVYSYIKDEKFPESIEIMVQQFKQRYNDLCSQHLDYSVIEKELHEVVDQLFSAIAVCEESSQSNGLEVETMGTASDSYYTEYSQEGLDQKNAEKFIVSGYGSTKEARESAIQSFYENAGANGFDTRQAEEIIQKTAKDMAPNEIGFVKKVDLIVKYFRSFEKIENIDEASINQVKTTVQTIKDAKNGISSLYNIEIAGLTIEEIAEQYINDIVNKEGSKVKPVNSSIPPDFALVCGLPGSGKSSVYVSDRLNQGYLPVDLDNLVTDYLMPTYNLPLNNSIKNDFYTIANAISSVVQKKAVERNYNVLLEKIGYTKGQINSIVDSFTRITEEVSSEQGKEIKYDHSLLMTACGSATSTYNNSKRFMEQLLRGKTLRGYDYTDLLMNNNCTTYAYLDVISDPESRKKFETIQIGDRQNSNYAGLSMTGGMTLAQINQLAQQLNVSNESHLEGR